MSGLVTKLGVPDSASPSLEHSTNMEILFLHCLSERFYTRMNSKLGRKPPISFAFGVIEKTLNINFNSGSFLSRNSIKNFSYKKAETNNTATKKYL